MTPVPIPDQCIPPGCRRIVIGPPDGDPTGNIRPVEAVAGVDPDRGVTIAMLVELDGDDLDRLQTTPAFWLTMWTTQIPPFAVHVADGVDWHAQGLVERED